MVSTTPSSYDSLGLDEFRAQALRAISAALVMASLGIFWLIIFEPSRWRLEPLAAIVGLVLTAALTYLLIEVGTVPATIGLLLGLTGTITVSLLAFGNGMFAFAYSISAIVAGMLLGWRSATVVGVVSGALILALASLAPGSLPPSVAELALLLTGVNLALSWLLARPVYIALDWAWHGYTQAQEQTSLARARQAELAELSKRLEQACERLEATNQEIERARRAAVEARRLKAEFASTISHELRTPLNLIIGFSEMMVLAPRVYGREALPEAYQGDVEAIYRNACHLSSLVDDVLELSQVEAHRAGFRKESAALRPIVDEALSAVGVLLAERGLAVTVRVPSSLPILHVDRTRVRQVLINLLNNAARSTPRGGVRIEAAARDGEVVVSVADSGAGIPPDELAGLFQEFHQLAGADRQHHSGLGLAISKRLVELHGGSMWAESVPGEGSTFYFSLPTHTQVVAELPDQWETWAKVVTEHDPAVLVVAERPEEIKLFERFLDHYQVIGVSGPGSPLRAGGQHRIRALVAVGQEGHNRLASLQVGHPGLQAVPVFSCALRTVHSVSRELGVADYLTKPVTRERLRAAFGAAGLEGTTRKILIVDDDPEVVRLLSLMIRAESRRYRVRGVTGGAAGLAAMREVRPDLVFLDLLMPDVDGYTVLEAMRGDESLKDVPVVVVSAQGADEDSVVAEGLEVSRPGGLSVGELMECLRVSLDLLTGTPSVPGRPASSAV